MSHVGLPPEHPDGKPVVFGGIGNRSCRQFGGGLLSLVSRQSAVRRPHQRTIARHTYQAFVRHNLVSPAAIIAAGWNTLVNPIMREGGYVRYDGRKSSQVLADCRMLMDRYHGSLHAVHDEAIDAADLERRLQAFPGIGPITTNIFLRELRPWWPKANPEPLAAVRNGARYSGIDLSAFPRQSLTFCRLEAGLLRLAHHSRTAQPEGPP